jgi:hypothetical protein
MKKPSRFRDCTPSLALISASGLDLQPNTANMQGKMRSGVASGVSLPLLMLWLSLEVTSSPHLEPRQLPAASSRLTSLLQRLYGARLRRPAHSWAPSRIGVTKYSRWQSSLSTPLAEGIYKPQTCPRFLRLVLLLIVKPSHYKTKLQLCIEALRSHRPLRLASSVPSKSAPNRQRLTHL